MRFDGTLINWKADRGFGFIAPSQGGQELFVHIAAFQLDGRQPAEGDALSFEVDLGRDGRKRAVRVQRRSQHASVADKAYAAASHRSPRARRKRGLGTKLVLLTLLAALGWATYAKFSSRLVPNTLPTPSDATSTPVPGALPVHLQSPAPLPAPRANSRCDGRLHCSQMSSCDEAKFFLQNCPGVKMDGDHDGVPCEEQFCS